MSDQDQPGQTPGGQPSSEPAPGNPPPPPPPPPTYPSYPAGQPASPYAQPGYGTPTGYGAQPGYGVPPGMPPYAGPVFPYAHWGLRVASYLLDSVLLIPAYVVARIGVSMTGASHSNGAQTLGVVLAVIGYAAAIGFAIWNQFMRQGRTGCSLGKQWVGTRLIREDNGQPLGGWLTFGRYLLHILDALPCYLGYLWPLWDAKRQTFADKLVHSVVVRQAPTPPTY